MYKFAYCQPHPKCPDLKGWYLILEPGDIGTLMELHEGITRVYYYKYGLDSHPAHPELSRLYHPITLSGAWLTSIQKFQLTRTTLAITSSGGMIPLDGVKVLVREESKKFVWPDRWAWEEITISRWPRGQHYYLTSDRDRIFVPGKYNTYEEAHQVAQMYTTKIRDKGC